MTSGIQSNGVDLDNIFAPYRSGTKPAATGILVEGVDIANRYQPLPGTTATATGIKTKGTDLNALFSTTAGGKLPIDGSSYQAGGTSGGVAPIKPCSGTINLLVGGGQYNIQTRVINNGGAAVVTDHIFAVPTGMTQFQITLSGVTTSGTATYTNNASSWTAVPSSLTTYLNFVASQSANVGTAEVRGSVTLNFGSTSVTIFTGTCLFDASADISA